MVEPTRLNKILAHLGWGSRREIDRLILAGRVKVNHRLATPGDRVLPQDILSVDGRAVERLALAPTVLAFNKPPGVTSTRRDRHAAVTVMDYLPKNYQHLYPVGRLDRDSRGLILLTNIGDFARWLTHPSSSQTKEYDVAFRARISKSRAAFTNDCRRLTHEIILPEVQTRPVRVKKKYFHITGQVGTATIVLTEGKKRQIRRLLAQLGYVVSDLCRTAIGAITLGHLPEGQYRLVSPELLAKTWRN